MRFIQRTFFVFTICFTAQLDAQIIAWSINDTDIKDRLVTNLELCGLGRDDSVLVSNFNPNNNIVIVARQAADKSILIDQIRFFSQQGEGKRIRNPRINSLPSSFRDSLFERKYNWTKISEKQLSETLTNKDDLLIRTPGANTDDSMMKWADDVYWLSPTSFEIAFPFKFSMKLADQRIGVFAKIGEIEFGFPGASISSIQTGLAFSHVKIYGTMPVLTIAPRRLEGALGIGFAFETKNIEGRFQFGGVASLNRYTSKDVDNIQNIAVLNDAVQLAYVDERKAPFGGVIRSKIGGIALFITRGYTIDGSNFVITDRNFYPGGYLHFEWISNFTQNSFPSFEGFIQSILGNRTSFTIGLTWNIFRYIGLDVIGTYSFFNDEAKSWSYAFVPWGSVHIRL